MFSETLTRTTVRREALATAIRWIVQRASLRLLQGAVELSELALPESLVLEWESKFWRRNRVGGLKMANFRCPACQEHIPDLEKPQRRGLQRLRGRRRGAAAAGDITGLRCIIVNSRVNERTSYCSSTVIAVKALSCL